jgi:hypothetical protein
MIFTPTTVSAPPLRAAWRSYLESMGATHALTLSLNAPASVEKVQGALKTFFRNLDREILGARFHKAPLNHRTHYMAFPEHLDSNAHVHALIRVTPERHARVEYLLREDRSWLWSRVAPRGTHALRALNEVGGWAAYMMKSSGQNGEPFYPT